MKLSTLILTENNCYKSGKKHQVKGIMVHSTGANNPWLKRYVGPDDGVLGVNKYNNHWNTAKPGGINICVHAFIGKDKNGVIRAYQTLPWEMVGWHSGSGYRGYSNNANNTGYIGFEICEDGLSNRSYFNAVYEQAVELCAFLCQKFGLSPKNDIICHSEGSSLGIASNHADVMHWFPKFQKNMDIFRSDVEALIKNQQSPSKPSDNISYKEGDLVKITGSVYYNGVTIPQWVKKLNWYIYSVKGNRAVINKDEKGRYSIMSPINVDSVSRVYTDNNDVYVVHTVVSGDTLWGIAQKYLGNGSRYKEIVSLNNLKSNVIFRGQKLKIPK